MKTSIITDEAPKLIKRKKTPATTAAKPKKIEKPKKTKPVTSTTSSKQKKSSGGKSVTAARQVVDGCETWIDSDGAKVDYYRNFFTEQQATDLFNLLMKEEDQKFKQYSIKMYNKDVQTPRLEAAFCSPDISLEGYTHRTIYPWTPELLLVKQRLEQLLTTRYKQLVEFEYALVNIYKDGDHYIGYHADRENTGTTIASISLGAERLFKMKRKTSKNVEVSEPLHHGSMMVMLGTTQELYKHALPKTKKVKTPRINITFRMRRDKDKKKNK